MAVGFSRDQCTPAPLLSSLKDTPLLADARHGFAPNDDEALLGLRFFDLFGCGNHVST
jgi:hypothetical protein